MTNLDRFELKENSGLDGATFVLKTAQTILMVTQLIPKQF